tara:strand:- start:56 stop:544 length:489 start_codon:yes stop_codon:yes gene_type:complete
MSYYLKIQINDSSITGLYDNSIQIFNDKLNDTHRDSGFDLFVPSQLNAVSHETTKIDHKVACAVYKCVDGELIPSAYYMYPRSSISKSPLRLANSVGIIDSGYRGNLIAKVDNIHNEDYFIQESTRLMQVCAPDLSPFASVEIVESLDDTSRGSGGFGSTGV